MLNEIFNYALPIGGGLAVGTIVTIIAKAVFGGAIKKIVSKIDIEKIEKKAVDNGIDKLKTVSFKQSIQPLVTSELQKVTETVLGKVDEKLSVVDDGFYKVVDILEKLSAYFDNSIAITDERKEELRNAIKEAKIGAVKEETILLVENDETEEKKEETPKTAKVER